MPRSRIFGTRCGASSNLAIRSRRPRGRGRLPGTRCGAASTSAGGARLRPFAVRTLVFAVLLILLPLVGCADRDRLGSVELTASETMPALHFRSELPSLPEMAKKWGRGMALGEPLEEWDRSWSLGSAEGSERRRELHRAVAPMLADALSPSDVEASFAALDHAVKGANVLLGEGLPIHLVPTLERAHEDRDAAAEALAQGEVRRALVHVLDGAARLRSVTPHALAGELIREGDETFRRVQGMNGRTAGEPMLRAERLLIGARDALENGSSLLALRRAWYALGILSEETSP